MKSPISLAFLLIFSFGSLQAEDSKCVPLKPGEAKASESKNAHGGKTLHRVWRIDANTASDERIVMNADNTVRGRVITTYSGRRPSTAVAYKGMADPWFIDQYTWREDGGFSVERRSFAGKVIALQIFPADDKGLVQTLDSEGNEISAERYKEFSDEVGNLLF